MERTLALLELKCAKLDSQYTQAIKDLAEAHTKINKLEARIDALDTNDSPQEAYYQNLLEQRFPGAGHRTLTTKAGSTIITDVTSPDTWNPSEHDGMPSHHIEIKRTNGYKEIISQIEMAQAVLPRDLLIGALFVNPSIKKLKDVFELFHPHGIKLCYFDHHDQLWWFDGQEKRDFKDIWKSAKQQYINDQNISIYQYAKDALLCEDRTGGITVNDFFAKFEELWKSTYGLHVKTPSKNEILHKMDAVLVGKKLTRNERRFGNPQIPGWRGWILV
jgi:hypothetical protein